MGNQVKAQYKEMERKVDISKETYQTLSAEKEQLTTEQQSLQQRLESLVAENKQLKTSLLDVERYKEEFREVSEIVAMLKRKQKDLEEAIKKTKEDLNAARMEGVAPKTKYYAPKFNKDTKVNLDMSMWIVHNITKEERQPYKPEIKPYDQPYQEPYQQPYEEPKYEAPKYEEPKYEAPTEAPKYEEPKYETPSEAPIYEEPKYEAATGAPKYEEQKYIDVPKYEEPAAAEEKY